MGMLSQATYQLPAHAGTHLVSREVSKAADVDAKPAHAEGGAAVDVSISTNILAETSTFLRAQPTIAHAPGAEDFPQMQQPEREQRTPKQRTAEAEDRDVNTPKNQNKVCSFAPLVPKAPITSICPQTLSAQVSLTDLLSCEVLGMLRVHCLLIGFAGTVWNAA